MLTLVHLGGERSDTQSLLQPTPNDSSTSRTPSSVLASWDISLNRWPNHSLPDCLQLLALHRPEKLEIVERIARAFAEPIFHELEASDPGEIS